MAYSMINKLTVSILCTYSSFLKIGGKFSWLLKKQNMLLVV